jgi:hypothetical protein
MMLSRTEILNQIDPQWREHYRDDIELAWSFYWEFSRQQIDNIKYRDNNSESEKGP